ncbi:hypothetical protein HFP15_16650 [Amycolatopsis sp. K13G38]|uniref:Uncharacterized protein n=1 Tax=Amycolatopsis acididurans TaxID=2724524 RepID=A0ABX1J814_9PSEU|nr:hypothetical protein [Amycolatopsis acididurans]NKQ54511.1 hypothetical protein [Amycolatopsis acididurans]
MNRGTLAGLRTQLRMLVTMLAIDDTNIAVDVMLAELAHQVSAMESVLSRVAGPALREIRSGLAHADGRRRDDARADFLMAAQRLSDHRHAEGERAPGNDVPHQNRIERAEERLLRLPQGGA